MPRTKIDKESQFTLKVLVVLSEDCQGSLSRRLDTPLTGGDFWKGAVTGATIGYLNRSMHQAVAGEGDWQKLNDEERVKEFLKLIRLANQTGLKIGKPSKFFKNYYTYGSQGLDSATIINYNGKKISVRLFLANYDENTSFYYKSTGYAHRAYEEGFEVNGFQFGFGYKNDMRIEKFSATIKSYSSPIFQLTVHPDNFNDLNNYLNGK